MTVARSTSLGARTYLIGYGLALALTALPFALVALNLLPAPATLTVIAVAAIVQILVHLRYFLHLSFSPGDTWFVASIAFTAIILIIMVGGTLWILYDLNRHMMP